MGPPEPSLADLKIDRSETERTNPWPLPVALLLLGGLAAGGWWWYTRPRPAEVLVDRGRARLVRRRETLGDLWRTAVFG